MENILSTWEAEVAQINTFLEVWRVLETFLMFFKNQAYKGTNFLSGTSLEYSFMILSVSSTLTPQLTSKTN